MVAPVESKYATTYDSGMDNRNRKRAGHTRRDVLKQVTATTALTLTGLPLSIGSLAAAPLLASNRIREENARPGTRDWMLAKTAIDPDTKYRCPSIEGYCSQASVPRRPDAANLRQHESGIAV